MDQPITLSEIIEEAVKINNCFLERSLEKKGSYNFRRRYGGSGGKKYRDPVRVLSSFMGQRLSALALI
jgi:hypothetical protein